MTFLFNQLGFKTITNDFVNFNHQIGLALIENDNALDYSEGLQRKIITDEVKLC
jgi:hypothetical protein